MKIKLPYFLWGAITFLPFNGATAQNYEHLTITSGLNADVIANGIGSATTSTSIAVDNANFVLMSNNFQATAASTPPAYALPATGTINSVATPGLSFQLAPYTGNNSLRIPTQNTSGTLVFSNNVSASKIYILGMSGSGNVTVTGTITFTDNSTQSITGTVVPDWFYSTALPVALSGFGRVGRLSNILENPVGNPRLYQMLVNILPANQTKTIASLQLTKTSFAEGILNIFAVTAEVLEPCVPPALPDAEDQALCPGATVADLSANGEEGAVFKWYLTSSGGIALGTTTPLVAGNYYVSQTIDGCESARQEVEVTFSATPVPETNTEQTHCVGATVADLEATPLEEALLIWSLTAGGEALEAETELEAGTYYVRQVVNFCESIDTEVTVIINEIPVVLTEGSQSVCFGSTVGDLEADGIEGAEIIWSLSAGGEALEADTGLTAGIYYTYQNLDGCQSESVPVEVMLLLLPAEPAGEPTQQFTAGATINSLVITTIPDAVINWYIMSEAEVLIPVDPNTELVDGMVYYVTQTVGDCESSAFAVTAHEALSTAAFEMENFTIYPNPATDVITISGKGVIDEVTVINLLGQKVLSQKMGTSGGEINISALPQGNYIVQVNSGNGATASVKIIKL